MTDQNTTPDTDDAQPTPAQRIRGQHVQLAAGVLSRGVFGPPRAAAILRLAEWIEGDERDVAPEVTKNEHATVMIPCHRCGGEHDLDAVVTTTLAAIRDDAQSLSRTLEALGFPIQAADLINVVDREAFEKNVREQVLAASRQQRGLKRLLDDLDRMTQR